jgi:hypothetical protein
MRNALIAWDRDLGLDARGAFYPQVIHDSGKMRSGRRIGCERGEESQVARKSPAARD